ncbi:hypothetical protein BDN72DRAFT_920828 [Pluteus cervinus]|uniref:Uncharacterized protein n=1 Tax=Pluteus cervinus TaxID=181527 RepID=A0ACD3AIV3_9AGAR|nr:hypothetical protein BDN72DRAFT_920828 [Pluteus cervinus]
MSPTKLFRMQLHIHRNATKVIYAQRSRRPVGMGGASVIVKAERAHRTFSFEGSIEFLPGLKAKASSSCEIIRQDEGFICQEFTSILNELKLNYKTITTSYPPSRLTVYVLLSTVFTAATNPGLQAPPFNLKIIEVETANTASARLFCAYVVTDHPPLYLSLSPSSLLTQGQRINSGSFSCTSSVGRPTMYQNFNTNSQYANNSAKKDNISIGSVNITYAPKASGTDAGPPPALPTPPVAGSSASIGTLELNAPHSNITVNVVNHPSCSCSCGHWISFLARAGRWVLGCWVLGAGRWVLGRWVLGAGSLGARFWYGCGSLGAEFEALVVRRWCWAGVLGVGSWSWELALVGAGSALVLSWFRAGDLAGLALHFSFGP